MSILKDLIVAGVSRVLKSCHLNKSGAIVEGDYRAIDGNTLSQYIKHDNYKHVYYYENGYNQATVPIIVDEKLKSSKILVVGIMMNDRSRNLPTYLQLYDKDGWMSSNSSKLDTNPIRVIFYGNHKRVASGTEDLYRGGLNSPSSESYVDIINAQADTRNRIPIPQVNGVYNGFMHTYQITKNAEGNIVVVNYTYVSMDTAITDGWWKYLFGGNPQF